MAALADLVAVGKVLTNLTYHLYQNAFQPLPTSVIGDFTEATFTGYVALGGIVWGSVYLDAQNQANVAGQTLQYEATDAVTTNLIAGYYVTQEIASAAATLQYALLFDNAVPISYAFAAVVFTPVYIFAS